MKQAAGQMHVQFLPLISSLLSTTPVNATLLRSFGMPRPPSIQLYLFSENYIRLRSRSLSVLLSVCVPKGFDPSLGV